MRVLTVDDHFLFQDGMKSLLKEWREGVCVIQAGNVAEASSALASDEAIDLVLLDLTLPDSLDPSQTVQRLANEANGIPVVAISMVGEPATVAAAVRGGARGFIRKSDSAAVMMATLDMVLAGGTCIPTELLAAETTGDEDQPSLSARQLEVLRLIADGCSNKEIARELGIAEATVKVHVHRILTLTGQPSRAKAAAWARRSELLPASDATEGRG